MRTILTLSLLICSLFTTAMRVQAATPVEALLTRLEAANPDCSLVAVCNGKHIVLLQSPMMEVEVKATVATKYLATADAASFVGSLARSATA